MATNEETNAHGTDYLRPHQSWLENDYRIMEDSVETQVQFEANHSKLIWRNPSDEMDHTHTPSPDGPTDPSPSDSTI
ncbi:hypothetical protein Tco_1402409 [Tanacetum coccineum]